MSWTCSGCGAENPDDERDCPVCDTVKTTWTLRYGKERVFTLPDQDTLCVHFVDEDGKALPEVPKCEITLPDESKDIEASPFVAEDSVDDDCVIMADQPMFYGRWTVDLDAEDRPCGFEDDHPEFDHYDWKRLVQAGLDTQNYPLNLAELAGQKVDRSKGEDTVVVSPGRRGQALITGCAEWEVAPYPFSPDVIEGEGGFTQVKDQATGKKKRRFNLLSTGKGAGIAFNVFLLKRKDTGAVRLMLFLGGSYGLSFSSVGSFMLDPRAGSVDWTPRVHLGLPPAAKDLAWKSFTTERPVSFDDFHLSAGELNTVAIRAQMSAPDVVANKALGLIPGGDAVRPQPKDCGVLTLLFRRVEVDKSVTDDVLEVLSDNPVADLGKKTFGKIPGVSQAAGAVGKGLRKAGNFVEGLADTVGEQLGKIPGLKAPLDYDVLISDESLGDTLELSHAKGVWILLDTGIREEVELIEKLQWFLAHLIEDGGPPPAELKVSSTPPGAKVFVGRPGEALEAHDFRTPCDVPLYEEGGHSLRVELDGHRASAEQSVTVSKEFLGADDARLTPDRAELTFELTPEG